MAELSQYQWKSTGIFGHVLPCETSTTFFSLFPYQSTAYLLEYKMEGQFKTCDLRIMAFTIDGAAAR